MIKYKYRPEIHKCKTFFCYTNAKHENKICIDL